MAFKKAVKHDAKLRLALCGPSGSGKTYSALALATALGNKIAYIDTEHGSASKYADLFEFDVHEPEQYDPRVLIEQIQDAVNDGYKVIVIDSLSHYWMGKGGELEQVDAAAKRTQGNSFAAWKHVTPIHNKLVDTIITARIHVIVTLRTKTEWVIEKDEKTGKSAPRKIGLTPIMRDGIEYEFDVCGDLDQDNSLTISKSRCPKLAGQVIQRPGKDMAATLTEWLAGTPKLDPQPETKPEPKPEREVPEELKTYVFKLEEKGGTKRAFEYMQDELIKASPRDMPHAGEAIYQRVTKKLREENPKVLTVAACTVAMLDMWDELVHLRAAKKEMMDAEQQQIEGVA